MRGERTVWISSFDGPWGPLWVASTQVGLCGIKLRGNRGELIDELEESLGEIEVREDPNANGDAISQLREYLEGRRRAFDLKVHLRGTPFQMSVWLALVEIPYGQTRSYVDIARRLGRPKAARAVGQANGRNPVPIVVPCHRVICKDGSLGGFGSGLDIKRDLLDLESAGRSL